MGPMEDLKELATKIVLENINDLHQLRFPVERKKLEHILIGDSQAPNSGATFFHKVMQDTNTIINWPSISKFRATMEDPYITLSGRQEDVQKAKDHIDNVLINTFSRVTLTMGVSHTDHPYIIGKGGANLNWIKKKTGCSICYPGLDTFDTSRRSNQVDIIGDVVGAEQARSCVRNTSPLIFTFELPIDCNPHILNICAPNVNRLQNQYNVQILLQVEPFLQKKVMTVRGLEEEDIRVKQATYLLMEMIFGDLAAQIPIQTCMEISSHYRKYVIGREHGNLNSIMENTQTQITFPDARKLLTDGTFVISGSVHNVYLAKQQLVGSLPLRVMFELPNECILTPEKVVTIQSDLNVDISTRHYVKTYCIISGIERYASYIYEARKRVLEINTPNIVACIPLSYFIPFVGTTEVTSRYSPLGESLSIMVSLKRSQEESYSSVSNTCTMSNSVKSPLAIPSSSHQANKFKHSTVSAGIQEMQNKQDEEYKVQTRARSGYGVSYVNFGGLLLSDREKIWRHKEDQPSKNLNDTSLGAPRSYDQEQFWNQGGEQVSKYLIYCHSKPNEVQQSLTKSHFDPKHVGEIREMQNIQAHEYGVSPSKGSDYGVNYTNRNEHQQSFTTPNFDQNSVADIPEVQNMHESRYQPSSSSGSGYKVNYTILGILELSD